METYKNCTVEDFSEVVVLITPFQLKQFITIREMEARQLDHSGLLIFYSKYMDDQLLRNTFSKAKLIPVPYGSVLRKELKVRNFFRTVADLRMKKREVEDIANSMLKSRLERLYIFTDREYFNQCLIWYCHKKYKALNVIYGEEGIGSYIRQSTGDKLKNLLYIFYGRIFIGFPLRFVRTLGSNPHIDIYYCRLPEHLPQRRKTVVYKQTLAPAGVNRDKVLKSDRAIILTAPIPDKVNFINAIGDILKAHSFKPSVKLHPRENVAHYEGLRYELVDQRMSSESLEYEDYHFVINFFSSALIDLFIKNYPSDHIITFTVRTVNSNIPLYRKTRMFDSIEDFKSFLDAN